MEAEKVDRRNEVEQAAPAPTPSPLAGMSQVLRRMEGESVQRSALLVGAADDPAEREADRVAADVMAALAAPPPTVAAGQGRVQRSSVGASGGVLDADTSDTIERRRGAGAPLEGRVRRRMEQGFGADLGNIRLHTGSEASALNESMSAAAFTVGNDVFLHDSSPSVSTGAGEQLLAHEIAHTFQQTGGGQRQLQRKKMMSTKAFNSATDEGLFTGSSKAQKAIRAMLDAYHAAHPWESQLSMSASDASAALEKLEEIRQTVDLWIKDHEVEVNGVTTKDPKRVKRRAGMEMVLEACRDEMLTMQDLVQYRTAGAVTKGDVVGPVTVSQPSEAFTKVKQKYTGDAVSAFQKLGFLIDGAVPIDGDKSSISMEITIPIPPGFIGLEFEAEAERDGERVEAGITVGVSGGASVGSVAKLSAGIGCYLSAKAKTGADVTELMSYALYRRAQESVLVPREISSSMWGGGRSGDYGWVKAEEWSKGVETRIFGDDDEAEVSSGAYGKLAAEVEVSKDLASIGFEVKGTKGTTINKDSIERAKGTVGAKNRTSSGAEIADGGGVRGTTQASLGVKKLGLETSAKFAAGPLSGGVSAEFGWSRTAIQGPLGRDGKALGSTYVFDTFAVSADLAGSMPYNAVAGAGIAALIPEFVGTINKLIRGSMTAAQAETKARTGGAITEEVGSYAAAIAELSSVPKDTWQPFAASPAEAGLEIGSSMSLELSGSFDFKSGGGDALVVELRLGKSSGLANAVSAGGDVVQVFKLDISKSSRLLKLSYGDKVVAGNKPPKKGWKPS